MGFEPQKHNGTLTWPSGIVRVDLMLSVPSSRRKWVAAAPYQNQLDIFVLPELRPEQDGNNVLLPKGGVQQLGTALAYRISTGSKTSLLTLPFYRPAPLARPS